MTTDPFQELRKNLLGQRIAFTRANHYIDLKDRLILGLNQFLLGPGAGIQSVALYSPIRNEVDFRPALLHWAEQGSSRKLALPLGLNNKQLDFYEWRSGDTLIKNNFGILEPDPNNLQRPKINPDCILLPVVGWTQSQENDQPRYWRLGYGGGYFDRTLLALKTRKPNTMNIGVGFDWQELSPSQWQPQAHDQALTYLLTESGLR